MMRVIAAMGMRAVALSALLLMSAVTAGAQSARQTSDPGAATIGVHGHWIIEVRDSDGSRVTRHEFDNALVSSRSLLLALSRQNTPGYWAVTVHDIFGVECRPGNQFPADDAGYGFDNVGSAGPLTHLTCVNAATGKRAWQKTRFGKGNLIAADGKLWFSTMEGELVLVRATPKAYEELGRAKVIESTRQAPSLAAGRLYLRDDKEIVCLDVRQP